MCLGEFSVKPIQPVACYRVARAARRATSNPIRPGASAPAESYFTDFLEELRSYEQTYGHLRSLGPLRRHGRAPSSASKRRRTIILEWLVSQKRVTGSRDRALAQPLA